MTLENLAGLLFGFPETFGMKAMSLRHSGDFSIRPRVVTIQVGEWINSLDPDETVFTTFLFTIHAEVWMTRHWRESTSYRITLRESVSHSYQHQQLGYDLTDAIRRRIPFIDSKLLDSVRTMIEDGTHKLPQYEQVMELLRLKDIAKEYEHRKTHLNEPKE